MKPWHYLLDATQEGPICPQHDEIYSRLMAPYRGMSEACIYGNVYVPTAALTDTDNRYKDYLLRIGERQVKKSGLRILVFIHGGAFQSGSADADLHGPEFLVGDGIIVITFNYRYSLVCSVIQGFQLHLSSIAISFTRINVFGFLSLNTSEIPGNAGMRDMITFLHWVQRNARHFGGDPDDVTLMGHSSGSTNAHLLSLSKAAGGLFKR